MPKHGGADEVLALGLLATHAEIERLCQIMAAWWRGDSLTAIAKAYGISRQRVHAMLGRVACTGRLRQKTRSAPKDHPRCASAANVAAAIQCLLHPLAWRLTPRQRCALAWRAAGLTTVNIAHRMGTTGQGVRYFLICARERLERLAGQPVEQASWSRSAPGTSRSPPIELPEFDVACLEALLASADAPPRAQEEAGPSPGSV